MTEATATATPAPMAPEAAQARIEELKGDRGFRQRFAAGDEAARSEMHRLHREAFEPAAEAPAPLSATDRHLSEIGFPPASAAEFRMPPLPEPDGDVTREQIQAFD